MLRRNMMQVSYVDVEENTGVVSVKYIRKVRGDIFKINGEGKCDTHMIFLKNQLLNYFFFFTPPRDVNKQQQIFLF